MKRIIRTVFFCMLFFTVTGIITAAAYIFSLDEWKTYQPSELSEMEYSLRLYDGNDEEYLRLDNGENRLPCDYSALPEHVKNAFIAIEDVRFYTHKGIDPRRMGGAFLADLKTLSLKEGASTITQQLVKLSVLTGEKTLSRKVNEIIMAIRTEKFYSKDEILELYLNKVYFGGGAYGIEAAAQRYFGVSAENLSLAQSAALAAVIKSPSTYAPHIHPEKCKNRRDLVLSEMLENNFISREEYSTAKAEPLSVLPEDTEYTGGYYTDYTLSSAAQLLDISMSELLSEGYIIETAFDEELQEYCETLMTDDSNFPEPAADGSRAECAVIVEESDTGLITVLIGGREHTARLGFSRATDMKRQPGSAIKPVLVFTPALEFGGYHPTSFLLDQPRRFTDYAPRNAGSSFRGWITLRSVIAYSVNIPAVSLFDELGIENCKKYAESVGIKFSDKDDNLSLALGGFTEGITPLSLAGSYQPFANEGEYLPPSTIRRILDMDGKVLYDRAWEEPEQVISEETAFLMSSMLQSSVEYGTAKNLYLEKVTLCAKTGTTSYDDAENNKDAWITAYNPEYVICTWMGFDKTDSAHNLKKGETGGNYPALLTKKIFSRIYEDRYAPVFSQPENISKVYLDAESLETDFSTVAVPAFTEGSVAEYFTKETAPRLYENDEQYTDNVTENYTEPDLPAE